MPKSARLLSDKAVQNLKPAKEQRLPVSYPVGGEAPGLYLQVAPNGGKSWLLRVTTARKPNPNKSGAFLQVRREFGLGRYSDLSLADARDKAKMMRGQVTRGIDPVAERRAADRAALELLARAKTFAECERAALVAKGPSYKSTKTAALWRTCFDTYVNPVLGHRIIGEIGSEQVAAVLEPIWHTKYPTAKKVRQWINGVFDYAKAKKYRIGVSPADALACTRNNPAGGAPLTVDRSTSVPLTDGETTVVTCERKDRDSSDATLFDATDVAIDTNRGSATIKLAASRYPPPTTTGGVNAESE